MTVRQASGQPFAASGSPLRVKRRAGRCLGRWSPLSRIRSRSDQESNQPKEDRVVDIRSFKPKRISPWMWRECIMKVWEVDPLPRGTCDGEMKIISIIYERAVIKKILVHLKLDPEPVLQRPPPGGRDLIY